MTGSETNATTAGSRVSFQLTYTRSPVPRQFAPAQLTGPRIPCAYGTDTGVDGAWYEPDDDVEQLPDRTVDQWVDQYASYALGEVVHEGLEWYRVDGRPWLDPHGPAEEEIHAAVGELVARLVEIRRRHTPPVE